MVSFPPPPPSLQAYVLLEGLIAETPNSIRKSVFYEIAFKELYLCLAELPFLADNTQSFARHDVRWRAVCSRNCLRCILHVLPFASVPDLGCVMGEVFNPF